MTKQEILQSPGQQQVLEKLVVQALLTVAPTGFRWLVAERRRERFTELGKSASEPSLVSDQAGKAPANLVTDQAQPKRTALSALTEAQIRIVELCAAQRGIADLLENIKVTNQTFFLRTHLNALIEGGILQLSLQGKRYCDMRTPGRSPPARPKLWPYKHLRVFTRYPDNPKHPQRSSQKDQEKTQ